MMEGLTFTYHQANSRIKQSSIALSHEPTDTVILRDVPTFITPQEALSMLSLLFSEDIRRVMLVTTMKPATYALIVRLSDAAAAQRYYELYDKKPFTSLISNDILYVLYCHGHTMQWPSISADETCVVCLESLSPHASQPAITSDCGHHFHLSCYAGLQEPNCPICRHSIVDAHTVCEEPGCPHNTSLWMCLICGHIGCGRLLGGHAKAHFEVSQHTYAVELETQQVWDYGRDGYVHRLLTSVVDNKLVEGPEAPIPPECGGALEGGPEAVVNQEFSRLLEEQLMLQSRHYQRAQQQARDTWERDSILLEEELSRKNLSIECAREGLVIFQKVTQRMRRTLHGFEETVLKPAEEAAQLSALTRNGLERGLEKYEAMVRKVEAQKAEAAAVESNPEVVNLRARLKILYGMLS